MSHNYLSHTQQKPTIIKRLIKSTSILITIAIIITFMIKVHATISAAEPRSPKIPQSSTAIWQEDFETPPYGTPPPLTSASGHDIYGNGIAYNTDPHWQPSSTATAFCNGFIISSTSAAGSALGTSDNCHLPIGRDASGNQQSAWWFAQNSALALGLAQQSTDAAANHAVIAMTRNNTNAGDGLMPNNGNAMLKTSNLIVSAGHYYQASSWFASTNCVSDTGIGADAQITVGLYANNGGTKVTATNPASPCQNGTKQNPDPTGTPFYTAHYATNIIQLSRELSYSSISIELRNTQLSIAGNDTAFDLPTLHDATPKLEQSFSTPTVSENVGFTSTLTYTIANTAELAAKPSLSFTNTLPYGITPIASSASSTCANQKVSITGQQVNFIGSLNTGDISCTLTIEVAAAQSGSFTNDTYNFADYANTGHYKPWGLTEPAAATLTVANVSKLELSASTNTNSVDAATENIVYSFFITNSGNVAISNLALDYSGFSGNTGSISPMTCSETPLLGLEYLTLQAGQTVKCFFTYAATQNDIDSHGGIDLTNSVVTGVTTTDQSAVQSNKVTIHVAAGTTPSLTLASTATRASGATIDAPLVIDEIINYSFIVTNISHATIKNITMEDTAFSGTNNLTITCPQNTLAPFQIMSCTATYIVTATDVASNNLSNTANARGIGTDKTTEIIVTSASETSHLPNLTTRGLIITNSHTPLPAGDTWAGDQLQYIFTLANTGNVPLYNVQVASDVHDDGSEDTLTDSECENWPNLGTLNPGEIITCKANYQLTQDDIDRLTAIPNTASATATTSSSGPITASATDYEDVHPVTAPDLTLTRTAPSEIKDGNINYTYTIYNNGNTTLTEISLHDTTSGTGTAVAPLCTWPNTNGVLAPKQTATCTATYQTTGSDILSQAPITSSASTTGIDVKGKNASSIAVVSTSIVRGQPGTISGHLYMDHNMNWHFDAQNNEPRIANIPIELTGTDQYGNTVAQTVQTNQQGEYSFTDLYPGTYTVIRPHNSYNHISVSSTGGYFETNKDGNPLPNTKNGSGSAQDATISKDIIQQIELTEGAHSKGNDFGETCGSIGNFIWLDLDRDGYADTGEPGISGVEVALYLDADGDGIEDEFLRTTTTDENGNYYFSVLDLNYRDNYLIQITDGNGALSGASLEPTFTAIQTDFHFDNCSSNVQNGVAYADTQIAIVENNTKFGWFDWINSTENPDLTPAPQSNRTARIAPLAAALADSSLVSNNSNLTADFGFMTLAQTTENDTKPIHTPNTGALLQIGSHTIHASDCIILGSILAFSGTIIIWLRRRTHKSK